MAGTSSRSRTIYGAALIALAALVAWALWPRSIAVEVDEVRRDALEVGFHEEGRTRLKARHTISATLDGIVERIELLPGDLVAAGQPLATIRPHPGLLLDAASREGLRLQLNAAQDGLAQAKAEHAAAQAQREQTRRTAARLAELAARGQLAQQANEDARIALEVAEARLRSTAAAVEQARHRRDALAAPVDWEGRSLSAATALVLRAPISGVVMQRMIESATPVRAGQPLLEIGDPSQLEVVVEVLTADALRLVPGGAVRLSAAEDGTFVPGTVRRIEPGGFHQGLGARCR